MDKQCSGRFVLACFSLIAMRGPAMAHQIGLAEQVLQPILFSPSLQWDFCAGNSRNCTSTVPWLLCLGLGLTTGLAAAVYLTLSHGQMIFPLALAAIAGGLVRSPPITRVCHFPLRSGPRRCHRREPFIGNDRLGRFDPNAGGGVPGDPRRASFPDDGRNSVHRQLIQQLFLLSGFINILKKKYRC